MKTYCKIAAGLLVILATMAPLAAAQDAPPATAAPASAASGTSQSAAVATKLTALLDELKLEAIAARDPSEPGRYIAALYYKESQLLVVSAPYPVPALLDKKIAEARYMDVYQDLQSGRTHQGIFFVMDLLADGLRRVCERDQPFDTTTKNGNQSISFDGNWTAQQLTEADYDKRFGEDDARYAQMLNALTTVLVRAKTLP